MKKLISGALAVLLLCAVVYAASARVTVVIPEREALSDGQYIVTLSLADNPGFSAAQIELSYNGAALQCQRVIPGEVLRGMLTDTNPAAGSGTKSALLSAAGSANVTADGTLVSFVFTAPQEGDPAFALVALDLTAADGQPLALTVDIQNHFVPAEEPDEPTPEEPDEPTPEEPGDEPPQTPGAPPAPVDTPPAFDDVPDTHWAHAAITAAAGRGLVSGDGTGRFSPDREMTRAEFITLLWNNAGKPAPTTTPALTDVAPGDWFYRAAVWGYENGWLRGTGGGCLSPNAPITREQAMTILHRLALCPAAEAALSGFADGGSVSPFAQEAMCWAVERGILTGTGDGRLAPQENATRAQVVTLLMRCLAA